MNEINIIPLGGQDETNKEMFALEFNNDIYLLDSGIEIPMNSNYGIKLFVPKLEYLINRRESVKGIFLSIGEKSKIGSLDYLIKEFPNLSIYGSTLTLKSLEVFFGEKVKKWKLISLQNRKQTIIDEITVIPFSVSSTVPGAYAYKFKFNNNSVIYLTNYIFDSIFEYNSLVQDIFPNPKEPTTILMSDSFYGTDNSKRSYSIIERVEESFKKSKGRIFTTIYNHDVYVAAEVLSLARKYQRKVYFTDKITFNLMNLYIENKVIKNVKLFLIDNNTMFDKNAVIIINDDKTTLFNFFIDILKRPLVMMNIEPKEQDLIILASPPISGNEHVYSNLQSQLSYLNSEIIEIKPEEFKSIRPSLFDLKNYLQVINPKYLIPICGLYKEQIQLQKLFTNLDNPASNFIITFNGQKSSFHDGKYIGSSIFSKQFGSTIIEGDRNNFITSNIIGEREQLGNSGVISIGVIVSSKTKEIISNPDAQMRGVVFLKNQGDLLERVIEKFIEITKFFLNEDEVFDKNKIIHKNVKEITKLVKAEIKKSPIIIIKIIDKDGKK